MANWWRNNSGTFAVWGAITIAMMIAAVGVGLDTYRLQNTRTALDHVVALTCDRVANADFAYYATSEQRLEMGRQYATEQVSRTSLPEDATTVTLSASGSDIQVSGTTTIEATLTKIFGQDKLDGASSKTCSVPSRTPPNSCDSSALIYANPGDFQVVSGTLIKGKANYVANLMNSSNYIETRMVFGNGSGNATLFLKSADPGDKVVLQPFRADGTIPAACRPGHPTCSGASCSPGGGGVCSPKTTVELRKALGKNPDDDRFPNPALVAMISGTVLNTLSTTGVTVPVPITSDFDSTTFEADKPTAAMDYTKNLANAILDLPNPPGPNGQGMPRAKKDVAEGGRLYRILTKSDSVWVIEGACVYVISPIALDLTDAGRIHTTGWTTAYSSLPRKLGRTVSFDMLDSGRPVGTEWLTGTGQALLVDNRDGRAAIEMSGRRLFGSVGGHENGYAKLAELDTDGDGKLTGNELVGLVAWIDDGDAQVGAGELKPLAEIGITELSTEITRVPSVDGTGTHLRSTAILNGRTIMTEDVFLGLNLSERVSSSTPGTVK